MKILVLLSLFVVLVFSTNTAAQSSSNVIEGQDYVLEVEPNTENVFIVYEDEGEGELRYTLKIRLTKETIRAVEDAEVQMQRSGPITAEMIETMLGPFMEKMDLALKAAEKNCRLYKCKQIIFEPRFVVITDTNQTINNALIGKPAVRTTTVILNLPKIVVKTPGLISRGFFKYIDQNKCWG